VPFGSNGNSYTVDMWIYTDVVHNMETWSGKSNKKRDSSEYCLPQIRQSCTSSTAAGLSILQQSRVAADAVYTCVPQTTLLPAVIIIGIQPLGRRLV
jgi:hypothetical protein